jgi:hypothetical protein
MMPMVFGPTLRQAQGDNQTPFVYPGVAPQKGEFLKRVEILGRNLVTVDVSIACNDPLGT